MDHVRMLEFDKILARLANHAVSEAAKARCLALRPSIDEAAVKRWIGETTQAKQIFEQIGTPPLPAMAELDQVMDLIAADAMLTPDQIVHVQSFLLSCRRMKAFLRKAEATDTELAGYGRSIEDLPELAKEIERCIRNGAVDDKASTQLNDIRRKVDAAQDQIKAKLDALLRKNKGWFSESFVSVRNGRHTLPVKREHKKDVAGTVVGMSNTGGTIFMEPASVGKLETALQELGIEEDGEIRRILYSLTALIADRIPALKLNIEAMETLDFLFAKGKLSLAMGATAAEIKTGRSICMHGARHPLLAKESAVPLDFEVGGEISGVVITGPNTGGKTVALKTVGLLCLMAQSGLHVPADEASSFCMNNLILCDIGDGQSITENLSTFSAHMKNVLDILGQADRESLVLLDELGSGTDPAEGMGIAVAVLDALCEKGCLFAVTTHYPELKEYATKKPELINARMAFDKETLRPLYRLEIGEAGESCALYIAQRLGMPRRMLERAHEAAYGEEGEGSWKAPEQNSPDFVREAAPRIIRQKEPAKDADARSAKFQIGDSVMVYPRKEIGIVFAGSDERGEIGVQVQGVKKRVNHKRIKLLVPASELYPEDYDFSIIFDSVENRKARHIMDKRHEEGNVVILQEAEQGK